MNLSRILSNEIFPAIEKPSQYLGNELNAVHKNADEIDLRVCFFFPDLYELGLGNLGLHILYAILNELDYVWCERGYTPAPDMEAALRERGLPMLMHESKDPLGAADLVGFTMQSELTYTNILNAIDLAGFPVRAADRGDEAPLFFAGGPTSFNPEPMAPFFDFFLIGEGEEAVVELTETLRPLKHAPKREKLEAVAQLEGFYVPALYPMETLPDGRILPQEDAPKIVKRLVHSLDGATFPTKYIVPYTQLVHDGVGLEVLRGCTQGCRFCQAGMVTRPVRERRIENIEQLMARTLENTGLDHVTLVSLSTCDFSRPRTLVKRAAEFAQPKDIGVSLPSLRLDSFAVEMADMVSGVRRSGLTFAPEAATPRLRAVINKFIPDEELLAMAEQAFKRHWTHVKTYFMIGLPTERDEDVEAIADLCIRTLELGKSINPKAGVRTGVSTFVPKPMTPFQWAGQIDIAETGRRQRLLADKFRKFPAIKFGRHEAEASFVEGLISRSDRRCADLIEAAWRRGAQLESWSEHLDIDHWWGAIEETGFDWRGALRERDPEERLPWDHIDVLIPKEWFQQDWQRAQELKYAQDCRAGKCHLCGVIYRERDLCKHMLKNQKQGHKEEAELWDGGGRASAGEVARSGDRPQQEGDRPQQGEPEPQQRLRFRIGRLGDVRFLSHLENKEVWIRALRRARAPLSYSQGFHRQPKITFATAEPLGEESVGDIMDAVLREGVEPQELRDRLAATLPPGFRVFEVEEAPVRGDSLMSLVRGFDYIIEAPCDPAAVRKRIAEIMGAEIVSVERRAKAKKRRGKQHHNMKTLNLRPMLDALEIEHEEAGAVRIRFATRQHESKLAKPKEIVALIGLDPNQTRVVKQATVLAPEEASAKV
ncbi:MAG: TIGR03960 family B12-binding radical SAM protein [Candidatus Hydrogenedentota bacterium]